MTGERSHGDEEKFAAATIEAWAPTSVTGSVAFTASALRLNAYMQRGKITKDGDKDLYVKAGTFTAHQALLGSIYTIFPASVSGSLTPEQPSVGLWFFLKGWHSSALVIQLQTES